MSEREFNQQVGRNVAAIRRSKGITQAELAQTMSRLKPLSWYQQTVAKVETGSRSLKFLDAVDLARVLDVSTDDLLDQDGQAKATRVARALVIECDAIWTDVLARLVDYGSKCRELEVCANNAEQSLPEDLLMEAHSILKRPVASTAKAAIANGRSLWDERHQAAQ